MDGHGCKMLMEKSFDNVFTVKLSPQDTDEYVKNLDTSKFDTIIFADIATHDQNFLNLDKVIVVDHHESNLDVSDPEDFVTLLRFRWEPESAQAEQPGNCIVLRGACEFVIKAGRQH